jgi:hypothetical protein
MSREAHLRCWAAYLRHVGLTEETLPPDGEKGELLGINIGYLNWTLHMMPEWRKAEGLDPLAWDEAAFVRFVEERAGA